MHDKQVRAIVDLLTIMMASLLLGLYCTSFVDTSILPRYGLPNVNREADLPVIGLAALIIGFLFEAIHPEISTHLLAARTYLLTHSVDSVALPALSRIQLPIAWPTLTDICEFVNGDVAACGLTLSVLFVAAGVAWYLHQSHCEAPDIVQGVRPHSARAGVLGSKKRSGRRTRRHRCADSLESAGVPRPAATDQTVEYDSAYSSSSEDERSKCEHGMSECCVCLEEDIASCAIMPCRHLCLCTACESIGLELCPICRAEITHIVRVQDGDGQEYF